MVCLNARFPSLLLKWGIHAAAIRWVPIKRFARIFYKTIIYGQIIIDFISPLKACFGGHCEAEMPTKLCWKSGIDRAIATLATSPGPSDWLKTSCSQHRERRKAVNPSATKPSRLVNASWDYLIPSRYEASIRFQTFFQHMLLPKNFFVGNRKGRFTVKDISCDVRQSQWLRDSVTKKQACM